MYFTRDESEIVIHSDDAFAQVAYLRFKQLHLEEKSEDDLDPSWMSDMNLDPVWEADSITLPIQDIVAAKLASITAPEAPSSGHHRTVSGGDPEDLCHSKFTTHSSPLVCAIGGTTAYDNLLVHGKRHMSAAEETTACLQNVQGKQASAKTENNFLLRRTLHLTCEIRSLWLDKLGKMGLSWTEVVFMQVFVTNMSDFGVVNGAYKAFFGINPPPRACVGANLPAPCRVQVSCTAIRNNVKGVKPRRTLHVQGMSYWAPANIGPYSQATEV